MRGCLHACSDAFMHACALPCERACMHLSNIRSHTHTHTHACARAHTHTHTHTYTHTRTYTHAHTHRDLSRVTLDHHGPFFHSFKHSSGQRPRLLSTRVMGVSFYSFEHRSGQIRSGGLDSLNVNIQLSSSVVRPLKQNKT